VRWTQTTFAFSQVGAGSFQHIVAMPVETTKQPLLDQKNSDYNKMGMGTTNLFAAYSAFTTVFCLPGVLGAVTALTYCQHAASLAKVERVTRASLGPLYVAFIVLKYAIVFMNANLGTARRSSGVNIPDQHVYKVLESGVLVLMDSEEPKGSFNRAQRAVQNLYEVLPMFLISLLFAGFVFPWTASILTVVFALARLKSALDYTKERMARMKGNMLGSVLNGSLDGIVITVGIFAMIKEFGSE